MARDETSIIGMLETPMKDYMNLCATDGKCGEGRNDGWSCSLHAPLAARCLRPARQKLDAEKRRGGSSIQQVDQADSAQMRCYVHIALVKDAMQDVFIRVTETLVQEQGRAVAWRRYTLSKQES